MLTNSQSTSAAISSFDQGSSRILKFPATRPLPRLVHLEHAGRPAAPRDGQSHEILFPTVSIVPHRAVSRRGMEWRGMGAELVQATSHERTEYSFRSPLHLLAAYDQGVRREGESDVEGLPRSTLRDVARKLTFVPSGHEYREWHDPRTLARVTYFYFDPAEFESELELDGAVPFAPRLFFEDATIWSTATKLKQAIQSSGAENRLYVEALGIVLLHEVIRLNRGAPRVETRIRGGLAAWQQRIVTSYIEDHLSEQVPLATLARLVRLSTYYFCRAFKQSFGVPPHRYHIERRIEQAKLMLAGRKHSVTEIGLVLGFSETSSFTAAFRKISGQTPSGYQRNLG
jgi:AraC family transcriptional regulator